MAAFWNACQYFMSTYDKLNHDHLKSTVSLARRSSLSLIYNRYYSAPVDGAIPLAKQKYVPTSGTYPKGFLVSGTHVGVKASNTRFPDLALLTSETPASAAAVFTQNIFQAAPVTVSRNTLQKQAGEGIRSIIINSGCANAVTGKGGIEDATSMAASLDGLQPNPSPNSTLVMSTGVIGQRLPIKKILDAVPKAVSNLDNTHTAWLTTARSICTTDTFPKLSSMTFTLPSSPSIEYSIAGMTKGAGMIHPNMATLLGILCTDAPIPAKTLQPLLSHAVERSFNAISIDGSTSTNDTLAILANGAAGGKTIDSPTSRDGLAIQKVLTEFTQQLSQLVVRDGEGSTKFVRVRVLNSPSFADTKKIASSIARDPLVKTALYGKDANWGRILCAIGYTPGLSSPDTVVPEKTSVSFVPTNGTETLKLVVNGEPERVDETRAAQILAEEDLEILVNLGGGRNGEGKEEASYWFCDFSHEYGA
jgi:glutamate N-acetyltransferase/amino-acid N-acetyltransferase